MRQSRFVCRIHSPVPGGDSHNPVSILLDTYRTLLTEIIREVVLNGVGQAQDVVTTWAAEHLPEEDQQRFINLVHAELKGLHEGNIARFRLRPAEFTTWQKTITP
jgi:hypothetical protein